MDNRKVILSLLKEDCLFKRQRECLERYLNEGSESQIEVEMHFLPPPQTHLIRIYRRRLELGRKRQQNPEFLKELERIVISLEKAPNAKFYTMEIDCDLHTDLYYFVEGCEEKLEYVGVLWGPRVPAYAKERPE